jgi:hypothetical protein
MPPPTDNRSLETPSEGYFRLRLVRFGPWIAARIVNANSLWWVELDGRECGGDADPWKAEHMERVWWHGHRISEDDYRASLAVSAWAKVNAPADPRAKPTEPIDMISIPIESLF